MPTLFNLDRGDNKYVAHHPGPAQTCLYLREEMTEPEPSLLHLPVKITFNNKKGSKLPWKEHFGFNGQNYKDLNGKNISEQQPIPSVSTGSSIPSSRMMISSLSMTTSLFIDFRGSRLSVKASRTTTFVNGNSFMGRL
jgi:hypothetical protein